LVSGKGEVLLSKDFNICTWGVQTSFGQGGKEFVARRRVEVYVASTGAITRPGRLTADAAFAAAPCAKLCSFFAA